MTVALKEKIMKITKPLRQVFAGLTLTAITLAAPAFAAETVNVELVGERGGAMEITLSQDSIVAGEVTFQVANMAMDTPHEMIVVKLDAAGQQFVVDPASEKVDEAAVNALGEVSGLKATETGELILTLEPGNYALICNLKGHVTAGMVVPFTVTAG
jgi:uncharacterized cupredoxin-like copper-binding protein